MKNCMAIAAEMMAAGSGMPDSQKMLELFRVKTDMRPRR